ncbi:protein kinase [Streptomyces polyrhachis]|uniref:Protein kinase n=1 Tax=Streptomyces polyrhachis TaxID=1282885 RepID=A0ABW2GL55_9ACTN
MAEWVRDAGGDMGLRAGDPESIGGYVLLDRLGAGGMGVVYLAQAHSGRYVAIKVVHQQLAEDVEFRIRFRHEVAAARRVSGAFTAPVVDSDPDADRPWMATLYTPGQSLRERVQHGGPLPPGELRLLAVGLVEALRDLHKVGVIHRDLKPDNIMLTDDGPRVIDFGISRAPEQQTLTVTGRILGTPPYMSPEQLTSARRVTPASDIFALGSVLTYATLGRGPFDADNHYLTAYNVTQEVPDIAALSGTVREIVQWCLAKDPSERPGPTDLLAAFHRVPPEDWGPSPVNTPISEEMPAPPPEQGRRRSRHVVALLTAGAIVVCAGAVWGTGLLDKNPATPPINADSRPPAPAKPSFKPKPEVEQITEFEPKGWALWEMQPQVAASHVQELSPDAQCATSPEILFCSIYGNFVTYDAETGKKRWNQSYPPGENVRIHGIAPFRNFGLYSTEKPGTGIRELHAVDLRAKNIVWSKSIPADLSGEYFVTVTDEVIVATWGGILEGFAASTGRRLWKVLPGRQKIATKSYEEIPSRDKRSFAVYGRPASSALRVNIATGEVISSVSIKNASIVATSDTSALAQPIDEEFEPSGSPILIDFATGKKIATNLPGEYHYIASDAGYIGFNASGHMIRASLFTGEILESIKTGIEVGNQKPFPSGRELYLKTLDSKIYCINAYSGLVQWHTAARRDPNRSLSDGTDPYGSPFKILGIQNGVIYAFSARDTIFAIGK